MTAAVPKALRRPVPNRSLRAHAERAYPALQRLERRWVPEARKRIQRALGSAADGIANAGLRQRLEHGDVEGAVEAVDWASFRARLEEAIKPILIILVGAGARELGPEIGRVQKQDELLAAFATNFQLINPLAVAYATDRAGEFVTTVNEETRAAIRAAIRAIIVRGQRGELTVDQMAREIRQVAGLNERQATAIENLRAGLAEQGTDPARIEQLVERQAERALSYRAEMIARTECIRAANAGQRALWSDAVQSGLLDPEESEQVWIAAVDACPRCLELDGERAPLGGEFDTDEGPLDGPPLHVNCRCAAGLETIEAPVGAEAEA